MTFALPAALLIHLQANAGQWLPLATLAAHVALPAETVQQSLDDLVSRSEAHQAQRDGQLLYGAGVEGIAP